MGRFVWFGLGAIFATWWIKSKEKERMGYGWRASREAIGNHGGNTGPQNDGALNAAARDKNDFEFIAKFDNTDRERLRELGSQASDVFSDMSESIIDTAFATLDTLRTKLAEQRAVRERMMAERKEADERKIV